MTAPIYRTDFPGQCRTHLIDGMTLIFHRPSGATHFLDSPVPEMLALLGAAPAAAAELAEKLCDQLGIAFDDEAVAVVETRLGELVASGLVQVV